MSFELREVVALKTRKIKTDIIIDYSSIFRASCIHHRPTGLRQ